MRRHVTAAFVAVLAVSVTFASPAGAGSRPTRTEVRGGWFNEAGFVPLSATATSDPDVYKMDFTGGSIWDGSFDGHTVIRGTALMNVTTGAVSGSYTEVFYGTYEPDGRTGSVTTKGRFVSDENSTFKARARIVGGSCGFTGSRGTIAYDGLSVHGGYVGTWIHPAGEPSAEPCAPPAPA